MLPAETRIKFNITSDDVLHSFWIPAFGPKIDAVPGLTTELYITTLEPGGPETDKAGYRAQCAELCGLSHTEMVMPVRVVEHDEFDTWLETAAAGGGGEIEGVEVAASIGEWFVTAEPPSAAAGGVNFEVTNDGAVPHEFVIIRTDIAADALPTTGGTVDEAALEVIGRTAQLLGGEGATLGAELEAGSYALICNIPGSLRPRDADRVHRRVAPQRFGGTPCVRPGLPGRTAIGRPAIHTSTRSLACDRGHLADASTQSREPGIAAGLSLLIPCLRPHPSAAAPQRGAPAGSACRAIG